MLVLSSATCSRWPSRRSNPWDHYQLSSHNQSHHIQTKWFECLCCVSFFSCGQWIGHPFFLGFHLCFDERNHGKKHPHGSRSVCDLHAGASMSETYRRPLLRCLKEIIKQKYHLSEVTEKFDQSNSEVGKLISRLFWYCVYSSLVSMHKCLLIGRWEVRQVICQHIWFWWPESQLKFHQTSTVIHENNGKTVSSWVSLQSCMK